jgi:hypothetical protein
MRRNRAWAAVLLAFALTGIGCAHTQSDNQVATNIKARMFADTQLKGTSLEVGVKEGVATLSGQVPSVAARYEAFKVASETDGVKKVNDQMTIEEPPMGSQSASNAPPVQPAPEPKPRRATRHRASQYAEPAPAPSEPSQPDNESASDQSAAGQGGSGQGAAAQPENAAPMPAPEPPAPPPIERITVPVGAPVSVQMIDSIDSSVNHTGDIFHGQLAAPIVVGSKAVAPKGANVYLKLVEARSAGHMSGQSELRVELYRIVLQGKSYLVLSNDYIVKGAKRAKRSALAIIGGAAIGAAIGAIAGGGKGAAIGAAAGGGGGAVYDEATKGQQVKIPSEAVLHFKLQGPVDVTLTPSAPDQTGPDQNPNP